MVKILTLTLTLIFNVYATAIAEYSIHKFISQPSKVIYFYTRKELPEIGSNLNLNLNLNSFKNSIERKSSIGTNLLLHEGSRIWMSFDGGKSFTRKIDQIEKEPLLVLQHPYDLSRAFVFTMGKKGFWTKDLGVNWIEFALEYPLASLSKSSIAFHAVYSDLIIVQLHVYK